MFHNCVARRGLDGPGSPLLAADGGGHVRFEGRYDLVLDAEVGPALGVAFATNERAEAVNANVELAAALRIVVARQSAGLEGGIHFRGQALR